MEQGPTSIHATWYPSFLNVPKRSHELRTKMILETQRQYKLVTLPDGCKV